MSLERAKWVWKWKSYMVSTDPKPPDKELKSSIEEEVRKKLTELVGVENIRYVTVELVDTKIKWERKPLWFSSSPQYIFPPAYEHHAYGITEVIFNVEASPIAWGKVASYIAFTLIPLIVRLLTWYFGFKIFDTVSSTVKKIAEEVPIAIPMGIGLLILLALAWIGVRIPERERK